MLVSIIIPVYFEEKNIIQILTEIKNKVRTPHEILIVHDLAEDPTIKVVKDYQKKNKSENITIVKTSKGSLKGVANAVKVGIKKAQGKAVVVTMADLSDDEGQIDQMAALIDKGYDIICPSRYMRGGGLVGGPWFKQSLSRLAGLSLHLLFKLPTHDPTNAFKMFRRSIFKKIEIESEAGFEYNLEVVAKAYRLGYKITEIPTVWRDRAEGKSKFKLLRWLPKYLKWYFYVIIKP